MFKRLITAILIFSYSLSTKADEGMWLPMLLQSMNADAMITKGLKIPIDSIYAVNKTSLKDAVVLFGGGCTGEMISDKGLLLTNHHCGYSQIQSHSSIEHDYLTDGFWAMKQEDELPCPGLTVSFIIRMDDVTEKILPQISVDMTEAQRNAKIKELSETICKTAVEGTHYTAEVKPFFYGNKFFVIVSETFKDVRMVGAPPSGIGKFGADADNWMWPRHTGDFSLFRIYAGKDNKPAEYSKENIPFKPRYSFPISIKGVNENDFTMVYGFPGRTQEYLPSAAVKLVMETTDPTRIAVRDIRLKIMDEHIRANDTVRIQYASKYAGIENAYKKWKGELLGLKRLDAIEKKKELEVQFNIWANADAARAKKFGTLTKDFNQQYEEVKLFAKATDYHNEAVLGIELLNYAGAYKKLVELSQIDKPDEKAIGDEAKKLIENSKGFFKNYYLPIDKKLFALLLKMYCQNVDKNLQPDLSFINSKYKSNYEAYAEDVYKNSFMASHQKAEAFLNSYSSKKVKKLLNDPAYKLWNLCATAYSEKVSPVFQTNIQKINLLQRTYMQAQMEMNEGKKNFYPDANSTLRVAYGKVEGYKPKDGVTYNYYTTLDGVVEKYDPTNYDFDAPKKLMDVYYKKDFGRYAQNGNIRPCFIASNHTTGGNSGSPVLNAKGELIGTNFDRVWEGTMSDIMFDPERCRNITLDIRYTLFVIDKVAECKRLIEELKIVTD